MAWIVATFPGLPAGKYSSRKIKILSAVAPIFYMRFSPDGARLRFSVGRKTSWPHSIWEARTDGSGLHEVLTNMPESYERCCGEGSHDGRYYFFQTIPNGAMRIWVVPEHHLLWEKSRLPVALTTGPLNSYMGGISQDG